MLVQLSGQLQNLEERLQELKTTSSDYKPEPLNTVPLEEAITKGIESVNQAVNAKPKVVVLAKRYLLFPEGKIEQYYKVIFGGIFKGVVLLIIGKFALTVLNRFIREKEYRPYKKAWQVLYNNQKEEGKQFLEKIWKESQMKESEPINSNLAGSK